MGREYAWKEDLMTRVQERIPTRIGEVQDQPGFQVLVNSILNDLLAEDPNLQAQPDLAQVVSMIQNTLSGIPWHVFSRTVQHK